MIVVVGHMLLVRVAVIIAGMSSRGKVRLSVGVVKDIVIASPVVIVIIFLVLILILILAPKPGTTTGGMSPRSLARTVQSGTTLSWDPLLGLWLLGQSGLPRCSCNLLHDPVQGIGVDEVSPVAVPETVPGTVLAHSDRALDADMESAWSPGVAPVALLDPTVLGEPFAVGAVGVLRERFKRRDFILGLAGFWRANRCLGCI